MEKIYWGLGAVILLLIGLLIGTQINQEKEIIPTLHPWESTFVQDFDTLGYLQAYESIVPCQPRDVELSDEDNCPACARYWEMDSKWYVAHIIPQLEKVPIAQYHQALRLRSTGESALSIKRALKL